MKKIYYFCKPFIPRGLQLALRRRTIHFLKKRSQAVWPIDENSAKPPSNWKGWPNQKKFALILTHDVDTQRGHDNSQRLMEFEQRYQFRSCFNFVPEKYTVSSDLRKVLVSNGFEVGVHGLNHDGKLYNSKKVFSQRAARINAYLKDWQAVGFRSPAMHHNLKWIHALNIEYDASTFDTDPFEPQSDGVQTIYPFWVQEGQRNSGYVELPYTLAQDFTLFVLMKEASIAIWKRKLDWISAKGGMALLNVHPDYMNFDGGPCGPEQYSAQLYADLLGYLNRTYKDQYWLALPREIAVFWKSNVVETTSDHA